MKCSVLEISIITFLCLLELLKVASSNQRLKAVDIIDHFIGLAEPPNRNNDEIEKRNSIVDGGVFVPYKSTTIVYKSRLVPVTYGFVIKKETLKDNPALYKLGVKLLDDKVEPTPTSKQLLDEKKVESASKQLLDAKSKCVKGSKVLRLLAKLSQHINNIENEILAQNQSVPAEHEEIIAKSLNKLNKVNVNQTKERQKPHPQHEAHVSGHKGKFEESLNKNNEAQKEDMSRNLSRYWQCRRSHGSKKCAVLLLMKRARSGRHHGKHPATHASHHRKHRRKHPAIHTNHEKKHSARHTTHESQKKKHSAGHTTHEKKHSARHTTHESQKKKHSAGHMTHEKNHSARHTSGTSEKKKHHRQHLDKHNNDSTKLESVSIRNRKKTVTKRKPRCKFCKPKHKHQKAKHRGSSGKLKS